MGIVRFFFFLEGKSRCITPLGLYPASRVSGHGPAGLGNSKLLLLTLSQYLSVPSTYRYVPAIPNRYVLNTLFL